MNNTLNHSWAYRWSFYFFIIFLLFSGISISVSQVSLAVSLIIWLFGLLKKYDDINYYKSGLERYIFIFVVVSFLLAFFSPNIKGNLIYIKDFWLIAVLVLSSSLIDTRSDIVKIVKVIIFIALINSILGIVQQIVDIELVNALRYGLEHKDSRLSTWHRNIGGLLGHHLTYGGYMLMITVPLTYLAFLKRGEPKEIPKPLIRISAILSFAVIILSWARSVIVSLPFALLPILFKRKRVFIAVLSVVVIFVLLVFSNLGPAKDFRKNLYNPSTRIRFIVWRIAFKIWLQHPVFGTGGGGYLKEFKNQLKEIVKEPEQQKLIKESWHFRWNIGNLLKTGTHPHNDYLNQLVRKGIVGLLAFVYMLFGIFRFMANNLKFIEDRFSRYLYMGLFGAFCSFLVASMFQCYYTDEENLAMFWFVIGLLVAVVKIEKRDV